MIRFLFIFRLKKKIEANPFIGIKQASNIYYYKEGEYTIGYEIKESPAGKKTVQWHSLKRRLTFFEEKVLSIKKGVSKFFLYQKWLTLLRPSVIIVLIISLIIFYLGIKEYSLRRIERFRWIVAQISGMSPESIGYTGEGVFKISGQARSRDGEAEPVTISFSPLRWLFFSDTVNINRWSEKLDRYITYPVTISGEGDIWLGTAGDRIHGEAQGERIIWDEPQKAGKRDEVSGHHISVQDGKLKIIDE